MRLWAVLCFALLCSFYCLEGKRRERGEGRRKEGRGSNLCKKLIRDVAVVKFQCTHITETHGRPHSIQSCSIHAHTRKIKLNRALWAQKYTHTHRERDSQRDTGATQTYPSVCISSVPPQLPCFSLFLSLPFSSDQQATEQSNNSLQLVAGSGRFWQGASRSVLSCPVAAVAAVAAVTPQAMQVRGCEHEWHNARDLPPWRSQQ